MFKKTYKIGNSNLIRSKIGFGCWGLGGGSTLNPSYGKISEVEAIRCLELASRNEVNFFDTSPAYGSSEKILGKFLKNKKREEFFLASKCGISDFKSRQDFSSVSLKKQLSKSLKNLGTDYLDLLQLHNPTEKILKNFDQFQFPIEEKESGRIRSFGISLKNPSDFFFIKNFEHIDSIQVNLNVLDTRLIELGIAKICKKEKVSIISRTPLCFGFLSGNIKQNTKFSKNDHRKYWSQDQIKKWVESSKGLYENVSQDKKCSQAQFCLKFCISIPEITITIPGMMNINQVKENTKVLDMEPLSSDEIYKIIKLNKIENYFLKGISIV